MSWVRQYGPYSSLTPTENKHSVAPADCTEADRFSIPLCHHPQNHVTCPVPPPGLVSWLSRELFWVMEVCGCALIPLMRGFWWGWAGASITHTINKSAASSWWQCKLCPLGGLLHPQPAVMSLHGVRDKADNPQVSPCMWQSISAMMVSQEMEAGQLPNLKQHHSWNVCKQIQRFCRIQSFIVWYSKCT